GGCVTMVPQARQLCCHCQNLSAFGLRKSWHLLVACVASLFLKTCDFPQAFIPSSLEIPCNQSVFRVDGIVLPVSASGFEARLFQCKLLLAQLCCIDMFAIRNGLKSCRAQELDASSSCGLLINVMKASEHRYRDDLSKLSASMRRT